MSRIGISRCYLSCDVKQACSARRLNGGFTLVELLVSMAVLALLIAVISQLFNATTAVVNAGNKHMDADSQARALLDRMALDFAKIVKRSDVDYYLKGRPGSNDQRGSGPDGANDQIAFYSEAPGYYPPEAKGITTQSPVSLVAYRLNPTSVRLQRLGKGLVWNGVSDTTVPAGNVPVVFLPVPIAAPLPSPLPSPMPSTAPSPAWPQAADMSDDPNGDYEYIGPQVFRFEYYYVLKGQTPAASSTPSPAILSDIPWDTRTEINHTSVEGLRDVAAVGVAIAVIDPKTRVLVNDDDLRALAKKLNDFFADPTDSTKTMKPGDLEAQWQTAVTASSIPRVAAQAIRIYGRTFSLAGVQQ